LEGVAVITRIHVKNFKRFKDRTFHLRDHVVLAGPNNSGTDEIAPEVGEKLDLIAEVLNIAG